MTKRELGRTLKYLLTKENDIVKISQWAFHVYNTYRTSFDSGTIGILECLFSMEDDPQFELNNDQLNEIADNLIFEGEKEELAIPIPEIKDVAQDLSDNWFMCPLCQEVWQSQSKFGMLLCPKCNNKLHNPKFI